jgi:hypothetical protein
VSRVPPIPSCQARQPTLRQVQSTDIAVAPRGGAKVRLNPDSRVPIAEYV